MNKTIQNLINSIPKSIYFPLKDFYTRINPVYMPHYNRNTPFNSFVPEVYNKNGEKMDYFFISDTTSSHSPYGNSRYFIWDRYNFGLKTHFYTHQNMLHTIGKPIKKYGWLIESEAICPYDYQIFNKKEGLEKDFDLIFTYSDKLLTTIPNARFAPAGSVWYGTVFGGGIMIPDGEKLKTKNISIIASNNSSTQLHRVRQKFAKKIKKLQLGDTFGNFDGGDRFEFIADPLTNYRYSIVVENDIKPYYFTEKILNCFASMTIPIYLGATKIADFFNTDGIITITEKNFDTLESLTAQCTQEMYKQKLNAIRDNYYRVQKFLVIEDYIYEHYL